jgi:signal transduction histidine kinase
MEARHMRFSSAVSQGAFDAPVSSPAHGERGDELASRKDLLSHMRHELRTPLNAILGYSAMLMEDAEDLALTRCLASLQSIHATGNRVLSLINDILVNEALEISSENAESLLDWKPAP